MTTKSAASLAGPGENRANELGGSEWTRYSMSVWDDIKWTRAERALKHPAMFPTMLVKRLIRCFLRPSGTVVLDPFMGSGSTLVAARELGKHGIGFEVYDKFASLAEERLSQLGMFASGASHEIIRADARHLTSHLQPESIDLCITSPPYWDILLQKRSADYKDRRYYGDDDSDLGTIAAYEDFLDSLATVFDGVRQVLRPGCYCVVNVMDLRKKSRFFPYHSDLADRMRSIGFIYDDLIIWDRRRDYNNLRSLGYPSVFRINKVHEFLMIFQKPKSP